MPDSNKKKLPTEPYRGVRDFYPEDMFIQKYIFTTMRSVAERFGYNEYGASVLEPTELYEAKSGEEIITEQTYTFTDRGNRSVTLRPEMTPTVARMVAGRRKELTFPLRWYSVTNLFRYERPQRGRVREHWQLNCDLFGVANMTADTEIIALASHIMREFGADDALYEIRVNHRGLLDTLFRDVMELSETSIHQLSKLIDRKDKISAEVFAREAQGIIGEKSESLVRLLTASDLDSFLSISGELKRSRGAKELTEVLENLSAGGSKNVIFSPTLVRGFDYYTGVIFEIFDRSPENTRSLFGGGRYDGLVDLFGVEPVAAVGFGVGDVTMRDFLTTHNLLPAYTSSTELYLATITLENIPAAQELARFLRTKDLAVAVNLLDKKIGDQIKTADRQGIIYLIAIGEEEIASGLFKLKHLGTGEEKSVNRDEIAETIFSSLD